MYHISFANIHTFCAHIVVLVFIIIHNNIIIINIIITATVIIVILSAIQLLSTLIVVTNIVGDVWQSVSRRRTVQVYFINVRMYSRIRGYNTITNYIILILTNNIGNINIRVVNIHLLCICIITIYLTVDISDIIHNWCRFIMLNVLIRLNVYNIC